MKLSECNGAAVDLLDRYCQSLPASELRRPIMARHLKVIKEFLASVDYSQPADITAAVVCDWLKGRNVDPRSCWVNIRALAGLFFWHVRTNQAGDGAWSGDDFWRRVSAFAPKPKPRSSGAKPRKPSQCDRPAAPSPKRTPGPLLAVVQEYTRCKQAGAHAARVLTRLASSPGMSDPADLRADKLVAWLHCEQPDRKERHSWASIVKRFLVWAVERGKAGEPALL